MKLWKVVAAFPLLLGTFSVATFSQTSTPKASYTVYKIDRDVKPPHPISTEVPAPPDSINKDLKVRVSFVVAPDGSVSDIRLLKRSKTDFDEFATTVVSKWKFEPATKDGRPVAVRLEAEVRSHK